MQVHDELVFEAPDDQVEATIALAKTVMIEAPEPAVKLGVPLAVEARAADNWDANWDEALQGRATLTAAPAAVPCWRSQSSCSRRECRKRPRAGLDAGWTSA